MGDTIELYNGDDRHIVVSVYDDDDVEVDITSATEIIFRIAETPDGPNILEKTLTGGGISLVLPVSGDTPDYSWEFDVSIDNADFTEFTVAPLADYYYEARITLAGEIGVVVTGTARVRRIME